MNSMLGRTPCLNAGLDLSVTIVSNLLCPEALAYAQLPICIRRDSCLRESRDDKELPAPPDSSRSRGLPLSWRWVAQLPLRPRCMIACSHKESLGASPTRSTETQSPVHPPANRDEEASRLDDSIFALPSCSEPYHHDETRPTGTHSGDPLRAPRRNRPAVQHTRPFRLPLRATVPTSSSRS